MQPADNTQNENQTADKQKPVEPEISEYFTDKSHLERAEANKTLDTLLAAVASRFDQLDGANRKEADKKKRENSEFAEAIRLVELLCKVRLYIHFQKMLEKNLDTMMSEEHSQRYLQALENYRNPYPLPAVTEKLTLDTQKIYLKELETLLQTIQNNYKQIERRMQADWGSTDWQSGLIIQTSAIHSRLNLGIENLDFLSVVAKLDAIASMPTHVVEKAREEFHHVNDALQDFLSNRPPPFVIHEVFTGVDIGEAAPVDVPALEVPEGVNPFLTQGNTADYKTEMERQAELLTIVNARDAYKNIGEPIIKENLVGMNKDSNAKVDSNSGVRLAIQFVGKYVNHEVKALQQKVDHFMNDSQALANLKKIEARVENKIHDLRVGMENRISPRPG